MKIQACLIALLFGVASGCTSHSAKRAESPAPVATSPFTDQQSLHADEALVLANDEAKRRGIDLAQYLSPRVDRSADGKTWYVHYTHKPNRRPGDHFGVAVRVSDQSTRFIGGR